MRFVRIFVAAPGDVVPERRRVDAIAARLNREFESLVRFETVRRLPSFYMPDDGFQPKPADPADCDIVVAIFWARIGNELPATIPAMPDGRAYPSDAAYELLSALDSARQRGAPEILVFRKTADAAMPTEDAERRREAKIQLHALEAFWSEWFKPEAGQPKAAHQSFQTTGLFEEALERLLRQWLEDKGYPAPREVWPRKSGSPFRGLAPFETRHAAVFFGRARAVEEARRQLQSAGERSAAFLLVAGASGAGKSSFLRAGLLPRLLTPGVVPSVDLWRSAILDPGDGRGGPILALAAALHAEGALPELRQGDFTSPAALADHLSRGGNAVARPILGALQRAGEAFKAQRVTPRLVDARLLLVVDPLDALFAHDVHDAAKSAFAEAIARLLATRQVWVVATLRAELYELFLKHSGFRALKEAGASLDLGPPGPAEFQEIIRGPAAAAGLAFEAHPQKGGLDERLLADAQAAESLPLLQFTLQQLYYGRVETSGQTVMTHAAYESLGGVRHAIAEEVKHSLKELQGALALLPRLLRRIAEPADDGRTLVLREAPWTEATAEPDAAALVNALLGAGILVGGKDAQGNATVRLTHEAVIDSWPAAREAVEANRDFFRVRNEVADAQRHWEQNDRPVERLLSPGVPLAQAQQLVSRFGAELPVEITAYVAESTHRSRRAQRRIVAAAVLFALLAVGSAAAMLELTQSKQHADAQRDTAVASAVEANRNHRLAKQAAERLVLDAARNLQQAEGMAADAVMATLATAKATVEQLEASSAGDPDLQRSKATMLNEVGTAYDATGDALRERGKSGEALAAFRAALEIRQELASAEAKNTDRQRDLAQLRKKIGDVLAAQQNMDEALTHYRAALALGEQLAAADPGNAGWQRELAALHERLGDTLFAQRKPDEALAAYRAAHPLRQRMTEVDPGNAEWQRDLAISHTKLAAAFAGQDQRDEALAAYHASLAIAKRLADSDPTSPVWRTDVLWSHWKLGDLGDNPRTRFQQVVAGLRQLKAERRLTAQQQEWLTEAEQRLAGLASPAATGGERVPSPTATGGERVPSPAATGGERVPSPAATGGERVPSPAATGGERVPSPAASDSERVPSQAATGAERVPSPSATEGEPVPSPSATVGKRIRTGTGGERSRRRKR